jgi:epoxyqueuosine reductase
MDLKAELKAEANRLGFLLAGITTPDQPLHYSTYERWLEQDRHGTMAYLANERARQRRADPRLILPEARSVLVLGLPYTPPPTPPQKPSDLSAASHDFDFQHSPDYAETTLKSFHGRIAAYAQGQDYHLVIPPRLEKIVAFAEKRLGRAVQWRGYTDTGPLLERDLAMRAGLGWIGKNTCLISPSSGSYFLLAEILWDVELEADQPIEHDYCGSCRRCIQACPTDCILEDRTLDARRCISYQTIENKGAIDPSLRPQLGDWVFGCDICQQVCPWNIRFAPSAGDLELSATAEISQANPAGEIRLTPQEFNRKFRFSPILRPRRRGYLRNLMVVLGNSGDPAAIPILVQALNEENEPLVRGHAAWALGRIGGSEAQAALEKALAREAGQGVIEEIHSGLDWFLHGSQTGRAAS